MPDTREKLIELIRDGRYKAESICNANKDCQRCTIADPNGSCKYGCIADHLIANGVTVQEWISVEDRLPEDTEIVLICSQIGNQYVAQHYRGHFYSDGTRISTSHWMPLPQPPKGE